MFDNTTSRLIRIKSTTSSTQSSNRICKLRTCRSNRIYCKEGVIIKFRIISTFCSTKSSFCSPNTFNKYPITNSKWEVLTISSPTICWLNNSNSICYTIRTCRCNTCSIGITNSNNSWWIWHFIKSSTSSFNNNLTDRSTIQDSRQFYIWSIGNKKIWCRDVISTSSNHTNSSKTEVITYRNNCWKIYTGLNRFIGRILISNLDHLSFTSFSNGIIIKSENGIFTDIGYDRRYAWISFISNTTKSNINFINTTSSGVRISCITESCDSKIYRIKLIAGAFWFFINLIFKRINSSGRNTESSRIHTIFNNNFGARIYSFIWVRISLRNINCIKINRFKFVIKRSWNVFTYFKIDNSSRRSWRTRSYDFGSNSNTFKSGYKVFIFIELKSKIGE